VIRWLDVAASAELVGAKLARLADLRGAGFAVPRGFAVTTEAYRQQRAEPGGLASPLAEPLRGAIVAACAELRPPLAVRSSATGEDGDQASFAGVFDSYLGVAGPAEALAAVRSCWASLHSERAREYGVDQATASMAVGVQEVVAARAAGVAFSLDPVSGRRDRVVIEASWGWGEAVVQGLVTPDRAEVERDGRRLLRYDVAPKELISTPTLARMPERLRAAPALDGAQASAVADTVLRVEQHLGQPVDVEWVLDPAGEVWIVQARPVTAAPDEPPPPRWDPAAAITPADAITPTPPARSTPISRPRRGSSPAAG